MNNNELSFSTNVPVHLYVYDSWEGGYEEKEGLDVRVDWLIKFALEDEIGINGIDEIVINNFDIDGTQIDTAILEINLNPQTVFSVRFNYVDIYVTDGVIDRATAYFV